MMNNLRLTNYYESFNMAVQMFLEIEGENCNSPKEWLDYQDTNYLEIIIKPKRKTLLHHYIEGAYLSNLSYFLGKHYSEEVIDQLIKVFGAYEYKEDKYIDLKNEYESNFEEYDLDEQDHLGDRLFDYYIDTLMPTVVDDIFTVLYQNKSFLRQFNLEIADLISELKVKDYPQYLEKDGVLKRCNYIPEWLKRGIIYRDKGCCQLCGKDLTGLNRISDDRHFDHIVPLELGGTNDPTNYQLTCEKCNLTKGGRNCNTKDLAMPFWDIHGDE